jgi:nucleoside-diphosphate-sugar epimerase
MSEATKTALVLGITGSVGREIAKVLEARGWRISALHRNSAAASKAAGLPQEVRWLQGDSLQAADVMKAAEGAALIVHAVNPPNYHNWRGLALPMLENSIKAAHAHGARIVLPATVYNYGRDAAPVLKENSPQRPPTAKGAVRVEMEMMLQRASLYGVRSLVVRSGDFFGPGAGNSWLTRGIVRAKRRIKSLSYPGAAAVGHSWAYLPDLAETVARLLESPRPLSNYELFHFRGHWFERGVELAETICRLGGIPYSQIKPFPWWALNLGAPFVEVFREMREMRYLWEVPLRLDNAKLYAHIGEEPHTPTEAALSATLGHLLAPRSHGRSASTELKHSANNSMAVLSCALESPANPISSPGRVGRFL